MISSLWLVFKLFRSYDGLNGLKKSEVVYFRSVFCQLQMDFRMIFHQPGFRSILFSKKYLPKPSVWASNFRSKGGAQISHIEAGVKNCLEERPSQNGGVFP